ncbi:hypothetical protein A3765_25845 [Oleiphilus sp. HI0130]|nr:hypothetical protein A3765_13160 [Oleiphilus sp. HI0130]KZZ74459.1 hypothetical protein A3765_25845 [Oleiphilus sp. HI0130]
MAFISEEIPAERKDTFNFPVQVSRNGRKPTLYEWVIDHANESYLVKASTKGGAYDGTRERNIFYFHTDNEDIYIKATPLQSDPEAGKNWGFRWEVNELIIPKILEPKSREIVELIVQAFTVWGLKNMGANYDEVEVEFLCEVDSQIN